MYGNILQQEQNRKNAATAAESSNQQAKTEGLLSMLGHKKKESVNEKHNRLRRRGVI